MILTSNINIISQIEYLGFEVHTKSDKNETDKRVRMKVFQKHFRHHLSYFYTNFL